MPYYLGIDVGTTGCKALIINEEGSVVGKATFEYPLYTPRPGWSEQDPSDWWKACVNAVKAAIANARIKGDEIEGVGLTGQMHGLVVIDSEGRVIRPAILWNDQRTAKEAEFINSLIGREKLIELTGNIAHTGFTAPKILWLRNNEPENFAKVNKFMLPKDYIGYKLTGDVITDVNDASGTSLFDVRKRCWCYEIIDELGIPSRILPEVLESPGVRGELRSEVAKELGLKPGTPVAAGAGDQGAAGVGAGIVAEGLISVNIGTSGVVFAASDKFRYDPKGRLHAFCHAVPGKWHLMGVMLSAGGSLRWFRDSLGHLEKIVADLVGDDPYNILVKEAERIPAGAEGLLFLPYLAGERTPHADPYARGVIFGLSLKHSKGHIIRAILEGVAYGLRDSIELMKSIGISAHQIRVLGGGSRSRLWKQVIADVFGTEVTTMLVDEGSSYGAAILASVAAGAYRSVEEAVTCMVRTSSERIVPNMEKHRIYSRYYKVYRSLYVSLKELFKEVAKIVESPT
ncbi:MAG: xylulokinase [Thermoprotei archaeon]|nr:MAG: xylulokinase [Thermoprotei archaeon]